MSSIANTWIYRLPEKLSDGFCHHGGSPIMFLNVDWFHVPDDLPRKDLETHIRRKKYFDETERYLVLGGPLTFTIEPKHRRQTYTGPGSQSYREKYERMNESHG